MDDKQFLQKLQQTQVLTTKEHTKWDWDLIEEVLEGPLRNPVHLHTATMRNVKFIKRILSFLKPHERGFFITEPYSVVCRSLARTNLVHSQRTSYATPLEQS